MSKQKDRLPNLPKKIKIVTADYDVKRVPQKWVKETESKGQCDVDDQVILIPRTTKLCQTLDTTIHEVFHGIYDVMQLTDDDKEEAYVARMATGWVAVMRDNPKFRAWVFSSLERLDD